MRPSRGEAVGRALADVIKQQRVGRGWSQDRLAEQAGLHRSFIGRLEAGKRGVSVAALVEISHALGTQASFLLSAAEKTAPPRESRPDDHPA